MTYPLPSSWPRYACRSEPIISKHTKGRTAQPGQVDFDKYIRVLQYLGSGHSLDFDVMRAVDDHCAHRCWSRHGQ